MRHNSDTAEDARRIVKLSPPNVSCWDTRERQAIAYRFLPLHQLIQPSPQKCDDGVVRVLIDL